MPTYPIDKCSGGGTSTPHDGRVLGVGKIEVEDQYGIEIKCEGTGGERRAVNEIKRDKYRYLGDSQSKHCTIT